MSGNESREPLNSSVGTRFVAPSEAWQVTQGNEGGFLPKAVIDAKVRCGTAPLYLAFPDVYHVRIEALLEFPNLDKNWRKTVDAGFWLRHPVLPANGTCMLKIVTRRCPVLRCANIVFRNERVRSDSQLKRGELRTGSGFGFRKGNTISPGSNAVVLY